MGEFFSTELTFCADSYSVSVPSHVTTVALSVLTLIRCPFPPMLPQWHIKDPSGLPKGQITHVYACILDPTKSRVD